MSNKHSSEGSAVQYCFNFFIFILCYHTLPVSSARLIVHYRSVLSIISPPATPRWDFFIFTTLCRELEGRAGCQGRTTVREVEVIRYSGRIRIKVDFLLCDQIGYLAIQLIDGNFAWTLTMLRQIRTPFLLKNEDSFCLKPIHSSFLITVLLSSLSYFWLPVTRKAASLAIGGIDYEKSTRSSRVVAIIPGLPLILFQAGSSLVCRCIHYAAVPF